jgi:RNA polymerase sigma-54 factor
VAQGLYISQRMSLQQVLAPQLQQSLQLLQAPTLELKALVEQELQQNPVLEEVALEDVEQKEKNDQGDTTITQAPDLAEPPADMNFDPASEKPNNDPVDDFQAEFERLTQLDQEWRDHFAQTNLPMRQSAEDEEKRQFMFDSLVAGTSLQENLMEQVRMSEITEAQRPIAEMIIGNIDDYGYLKTTVEELAFSTGIPSDEILAVLKSIQTFHPPGVGARDLRECLMLQLERDGRKSTVEYRIVSEFMEALGKRRLPEIARGVGQSVDDVQKAVARIGLLEPRPGRAFLPDNDQFIMPEVFVHKADGEFAVTTNNEQIPHLRISNTYKDLMGTGRQFERGARVHPRENSRRKVSHQKPAAASADDPEYRQGDREAAARVHGEGRGLPEANDNGAGGGSGGRARDDGEPCGVRQIHPDSAGDFRNEVFLHVGHPNRVR